MSVHLNTKWPDTAGRVTGCAKLWVRSSVRSVFRSSSSFFLRDALSQSSPNFDKTKIDTSWDRYERPLSNPQVFQNNFPSAIVLSRKIGNTRVEEQHVAGFITNRSFKCSPYLLMNTTDAQEIIKKKRQSNTHAYAMQYLKKNLVACQVWSKVKLFHMLFDSYLNHVRQALSALLKLIMFYITMQCKGQHKLSF